MPTKSVREMNSLERAHYSIRSRTFKMILACTLIISISAIAFGIVLYSISVRNQYITIAHNIAKLPTMLFNEEESKTFTEPVMKSYYDLAGTPGCAENSDDYLSNFEPFYTEEYQGVRERLYEIEQKNDVSSVYLGAIDLKNKRLVYLIDSDHSDTYCPIGYTEEMSDNEIRQYTDKSIEVPSEITNTDKFGYLCTSGITLYETDDYIITSFTDVSMDDIVARSRGFFWQYVLSLLIIGTVTAIIFTQLVKRKVARPIDRLATAALEYSNANLEDDSVKNHFSDLDIHTGDEIENLCIVMEDMENEVRRRIKEMRSINAEKERISTELSLANRIQQSMLPSIFPAFPERTEFDLFAQMRTAKEVGGDFYDYFLIDKNHLCLVMADVSGKGVPAALFMMASKIILGSCAMLGKSPAEILAMTNQAICSNNTEDMFVTVWLGILDIRTGTLTAANAGHEYPMLMQPDGKFEIVKDRHGLFIGAMEGIKYQEYTLQLQPGAKLFLYTDGVTEATNAEEKMFGMDKTVDALNLNPKASTHEILETVQREIDGFVKEADQFDDITMLCLEYRGTDENNS
jgi:sigma-B regulation protein RsbU (phosphoserine phosphatase)